MTSPRFCGSSYASPNPQAFTAASKVATYFLIDQKEWQSSTKYYIALYLAKASNGGSRKWISRAFYKPLYIHDLKRNLIYKFLINLASLL